LTPTGEPEARHENSATSIGSKLYVLGGRGERGVDILDLATGAWSKGAAPPIELHHFQAVTHEGVVMVIGALTGKFPAEPPVPVVYIYDPAADEWREGASIPEARRRGAAGVAFYEGRFFVAGGLTRGHNGGFVPWLDAFDPATGAWETLADAPRPRDHFAAAIIRGKLYLAGGRTTSHATGQALDLTISEVDVYDLAAGTWATLPPASNIPTPRAGTAAVVLGDDIVVLGGESTAQKAAHAEVEALHIATGTWTPLASLAQGRHGTGAAIYMDRIHIAAGSGNRGGGPELTSVEAWTPDK
jgi:N-acetylneuraminic acid mutarotase